MVPVIPEKGAKVQVERAKVRRPAARPPRFSKKALMTRCATLPVDLPSDKELQARAGTQHGGGEGQPRERGLRSRWRTATGPRRRLKAAPVQYVPRDAGARARPGAAE
ncbi:hypothetical protein Stube_19380 [Streptomyces tubercidicus]|uniref:Uncharacterized protein n=1 Tax=Streptomyces tubercidicus TaxID=47759 RepID=A0A640USH8_9ACTN|nr:hypothetical protein Stube_19380 [Streptomyces tubercidicus]